jgi:hypothetical protein
MSLPVRGLECVLQPRHEPMGRMAELIQRRREAAEIMAEVVLADGRRGRSNSCPWGSGASWKHGDGVVWRPVRGR